MRVLKGVAYTYREIDDVVECSREIQLMRVTRDLVTQTGVPEEDRHRKEVGVALIDFDVVCLF